MRAASTLTVIGSALWLAASSAHALGFGRVTNATQLGQPLNFAAALRMEADESLPRECVSAEVQSGDSKLQPGQIRTTLEGAPDSLERSVRVTTSTVIDEPVVTISVTVGCTARMTRRFVAFIDPPLINLAQGGAAPPTLPPQRFDSQVAPLVTLVEGEKPQSAAPLKPPERSAPARVRQRAPTAPRVVASGVEVEPAPARAPKNSAARRPVAGARAAVSTTSGPRLKLETASVAAVANAASAASSPQPVAAAALASAEAASANALVKEQADQVAKERERIQVLEEGLSKLRAESQLTQKSLATLQARLKEAESERYANPLVYGLAWLSTLLALAVAVLLWRQSRGRHASQWWAAPTTAPASAADARTIDPARVASPLVSAPQGLDDPTTGAGAFNIPTIIEDDEPQLPATPATRPVPFAPSASMPMQGAPEPARELSVEELIDLEQQAEFFIVLGQDEAAIELLMSHVRSDGGISPLPYLKLLEIYRRRGESEAYERIRDRFNRRFNAYAPDWDADLQQGRALVDYPDTIEQLQGLWATPTRVMGTLDASLFRRNKSDETFDLPAYRELLFLYSIARDLAEHGGTAPLPDVDLLLPLDEGPNAEPIARLSATTRPAAEFQRGDLVTMPLDLDVSFGHAEKPFDASTTLPGVPARTLEREPAADSNFIDFNLNEPHEPDPKP